MSEPAPFTLDALLRLKETMEQTQVAECVVSSFPRFKNALTGLVDAQAPSERSRYYEGLTLHPAPTGIPVVVDESLPVDQAEFRDKDGRVIATFTFGPTS